MLLNLPLGAPVDDPVAWAETAAQPGGIGDRGPDGRTIVRRLDSPLRIHAVTVTAGSPVLRTVQSASWFAGFCRRWVITARPRVPMAAILEAKLCGVGLMTQGGQVLLDAEPPVVPTVDGWTWLLQEKAYGRMLRGRGRPHPAAVTRAILS
jgi:hypothetical protein